MYVFVRGVSVADTAEKAKLNSSRLLRRVSCAQSSTVRQKGEQCTADVLDLEWTVQAGEDLSKRVASNQSQPHLHHK